MTEKGDSRPVGDGKQEFIFRNVQLFKNETLGTGSYGAVCKAKCDQLICAAKLIFPVLFRIQITEPGKEHRQPFHRFEQECRFLSQVNHPKIVQYLGTYRDPETNAPVLLMELMDESLTHFLESSPGDIPYHIQVNLSLQDIAQALVFLHANGIIHRDLSSNNVLLIAGDRAKVSDFGMSKFSDMNITRPGTQTQCPGTPVFMSPEALDEPPLYTEKLDIFSFGVILIQIMTQKFPEPSVRFDNKQFSDSQNPFRKINAKVLIPEFERRQAHISLIEPTHPLLPIALECLKDEAEERPSSQQLCQSMDALKRTVKYEQSQQQADAIIIQQKEEKQQLSETDQPIQINRQDLQMLRHEIEAKQRQLEAKDEKIKIKDNVVLAKDQEVQSLQHETEAMKHQLRKLNEQLESNEETTAILQTTITQRDKEIAELREIPATLQQTITQQDREIVELREHMEHDRVGTSQPYISMSWESLTSSATQFAPTSAVVGDEVYLSSLSDFHIWQFTLSIRQWKILFKHVLRDFSLVNIENELTTVGGCCSVSRHSDKLYSYTEGGWVEKYPPMPTKRCKCASVYSRNVLVVAGGQQNTEGRKVLSIAIEILNIDSMQWSQLLPLTFSISWPSISICGEYVHISTGSKQYPIVRCSLFSPTPLPGPGAVNWEEIAPLPVVSFTLVTIKGHLVAVGGKSIAEKRNVGDIHQYNPLTNQWQVINRMRVARSECAAALVQNNKLIVVGGAFRKDPIEVASIF